MYRVAMNSLAARRSAHQSTSIANRLAFSSFPSPTKSFHSNAKSTFAFTSAHTSIPPRSLANSLQPIFSSILRRSLTYKSSSQAPPHNHHSNSSSSSSSSVHSDAESRSVDDSDSSSAAPLDTEFDERPSAGHIAMEVSSTGSVSSLVYNRRDLARRFGLHPRDLRFLDSSLRNLPSILARKKVVIVNLELLKAIISADSVVLFDSHHPHVQSVVSQIQTFVKRGNELALNEERLPFELISLEYILTAVCRNLEGRFESYASTLANLLGDSSAILSEGSTLIHLLQLKNGLTAFEVVLKETGKAIKDILESDEDMNTMYLTAKEQGIHLSVDQHAEVEVILETYLRKVDELENEVKTDVKSLSLTEEHIQIRLDTARNAIMKLELLVSITTLGVAIAALGAGMFGMNLHNNFESSQYGLYVASLGCVAVGFLGARFGLRMARRHKIDLFHVDAEEPKFELPVSNKKRNRIGAANNYGNCISNGIQTHTRIPISSSSSSSRARSYHFSRSFSSSSTPIVQLQQWQNFNAAGLKYLSQGNYSEAEQLFISAMRDEGARESDGPYIYLSLANLASVHRLTGRLNESEKNYRYAIDHMQPFNESRQNRVPQAVSAHIHRGFGLTLEELKKYSEAELHYSTSFKLYSNCVEFLEKTIKNGKSNGNADEKWKELESELSALQKERSGSIFGVGFVLELQTLEQTRDSQLKNKLAARCEESYKTAIELARRAFGENSVNLAQVYSQLGQFLVQFTKQINEMASNGENANDFSRAQDYLMKAMEIFEKENHQVGLGEALKAYLTTQMTGDQTNEILKQLIQPVDISKTNKK